MERLVISIVTGTVAVVGALIIMALIGGLSHVLASYIATRVAKNESSKMMTYFFLVILFMLWFSAIFSVYIKPS